MLCHKTKRTCELSDKKTDVRKKWPGEDKEEIITF